MLNQQTIEMQETQQAIREQAQETFRNHLKHFSVVRTKDGLIESYRDFWNPLVAIESVGSMTDAVRFSE